MPSEPPKLPDRFKPIPLSYDSLAYQYRDLLTFARSFISAYDHISHHAHSLEVRMCSAIESSEKYEEAYTALIELHRKSVYGDQSVDNTDWSYNIPTKPWGSKVRPTDEDEED